MPHAAVRSSLKEARIVSLMRTNRVATNQLLPEPNLRSLSVHDHFLQTCKSRRNADLGVVFLALLFSGGHDHSLAALCILCHCSRNLAAVTLLDVAYIPVITCFPQSPLLPAPHELGVFPSVLPGRTCFFFAIPLHDLTG